MRRVGVLLNTNQLGGAERSLIEQLSLDESGSRIKIYIPKLKLSDEKLRNFLVSKGKFDIDEYRYPKMLYQISRRDLNFLPLLLPALIPLLLIHLISWYRLFRQHDILYINGNKAAIPVLLLSLVFRMKKCVIWHFRDFPSQTAFRFIGPILEKYKPKSIQLRLVANSHAVARELKKYFYSTELRTIYNLAGDLSHKPELKPITHIGIVSMLAPWKGIHEVLLMCAFFEKELKEMGVDKISFYGDSIYQTKGEHQEYADQLRRLCEKFKIEIVNFPGSKNPKEIFYEIDLLIHPSISPEPFGRVIVEAFKSGVPVVSSGLGGAAELVIDHRTGLIFITHDYQSLYVRIKELIENKQLVTELISSSSKRVSQIESSINTEIHDLFIFE